MRIGYFDLLRTVIINPKNHTDTHRGFGAVSNNHSAPVTKNVSVGIKGKYLRNESGYYEGR